MIAERPKVEVGVRLVLEELPQVTAFGEVFSNGNGSRHIHMIVEGGDRDSKAVRDILYGIAGLNVNGFGFPDQVPDSIGGKPTELIDRENIWKVSFHEQF